jgi:hypothetical protein
MTIVRTGLAATGGAGGGEPEDESAHPVTRRKLALVAVMKAANLDKSDLRSMGRVALLNAKSPHVRKCV